jgi:hypothetical protein
MSFILPWGPLHLLTAERTAGLVDIPNIVQEDDVEKTPASTSGLSLTTTSHPPNLERKQTMSGNILVITSNAVNDEYDDNNNNDTARNSTMTPCAFWLQRKLEKLHDGLIRLGYQLKQQHQGPFVAAGGKWDLDTDALGRQTLVAIHILPSSVLEVKPAQSNDRAAVVATANAYSPLNELCALQRIANHQQHLPFTNSQQKKKHVVGTRLVATSSEHVYAVLPYYRDGTLLQFCQTVGNLPEPLARYFFRKIVKVGEEYPSSTVFLVVLIAVSV